MHFLSLDKVISSHTSSWKDVMYLGNHPSFHMLIIKTRVQFLSFKMFSAWKHFRFAKRKVRLPNGVYSTALKLMKYLPSLYKNRFKEDIHSFYIVINCTKIPFLIAWENWKLENIHFIYAWRIKFLWSYDQMKRVEKPMRKYSKQEMLFREQVEYQMF